MTLGGGYKAVLDANVGYFAVQYATNNFNGYTIIRPSKTTWQPHLNLILELDIKLDQFIIKVLQSHQHHENSQVLYIR